MKLIFFLMIISFCFLTNITQAQWYDGITNGMYHKTGNIGIGFNNPNRLLPLRGSNSLLQIDRDNNTPEIGLTRYAPNSNYSTVYKSLDFSFFVITFYFSILNIMEGRENEKPSEHAIQRVLMTFD